MPQLNKATRQKMKREMKAETKAENVIVTGGSFTANNVSFFRTKLEKAVAAGIPADVARFTSLLAHAEEIHAKYE